MKTKSLLLLLLSPLASCFESPFLSAKPSMTTESYKDELGAIKPLGYYDPVSGIAFLFILFIF